MRPPLRARSRAARPTAGTSRGSPGTRALAGCCRAAGAQLAGPQQAIAQLAFLLGTRVERGRVGQRIDSTEAEQALEERGRPVEDRAELRAAAVFYQPPLLERRDRGLRVDAADARDLRSRDRLQVGDDREALGLRLRQRRRARLGQQAAGGLLRGRITGERPAPGDLTQDEPAVALAQFGERGLDLAGLNVTRLGQVLDRDGFVRQEEQGFDDASELGHARTGVVIVIGPNGTSCSHTASPCLYSSSSASSVTASVSRSPPSTASSKLKRRLPPSSMRRCASRSPTETRGRATCAMPSAGGVRSIPAMA